MSELKAGAPVAVGYEAVPESGEGPGVLVLHAWWGLNGVFRGLCDTLAAAGFVAVAPDLWGGTVATTIEQAEGLIKFEHGGSDAIGQAINSAIDYLKAHPAVRGEDLSVIGFSMGAFWAVHFAGLRPELRKVVIFYGAGDGDFAAMKASFLGHFAEDDPWEPLEGVRQMEESLRAAGREVTLHFYPGTGHWFFEPDRPDAFKPEAAQLAWERTLAFLKES
jgi:carboxymethylenebutenolidase